MPIARLASPLLLAAVLACSASSAAAQPPFPHSYRGTITGSSDAPGSSSGTRIKASWTIKNVVLRLTRVRKSDASWSAWYAVTSGTIAYHEAETGTCTYALDLTLPLRRSLSTTSAPFALSQSLFFKHRTTALGLMTVERSFKTTETCAQPDGEPAQVSTRKIQPGTLFDPGESVVKLGRRFAGHNGYSDDYTHSTTKWSWVLNP
jgi:hypothetical protein